MLWGVDSSSPPSAAAAQAVAAQGWSFYGLYIGGNTPYAWKPADVDLLAQAGFRLLPIFVAPYGLPSSADGARDGELAYASLGILQLKGLVVLDVESGAIPEKYVRAFTQVLNETGHRVCLYGLSDTLAALAQPSIVDASWLAYWPSMNVDEYGAPADWDIWQFKPGRAFNYSVAREDFMFAGYGGQLVPTQETEPPPAPDQADTAAS